MLSETTEQRILVAHDVDGEKGTTGASFTLLHARTGRPQAYLLVNGRLQELQHFKQMYSCWVMDDHVLADGGMYVSTPVDVLLVLLPYLERGRAKSGSSPAGVFCSAEQLLTDQGCPALARLLPAVEPHLGCVCDVKEAGGDHYYRLNDARVLSWLSCKVRQVHAALTQAGVLSGMDESSQLAYAVEFLAEYLSEDWSRALAGHLNVKETGASGGALRPVDIDNAQPPPSKRVKVDPKEVAREAARKRAEETRQCQLAKQAAGTRKISAFFGKPKPTPSAVAQPTADQPKTS